LASVLIDDGQDADPASIRESLRHEIHTPPLVGTHCRPLRHALTLGSLLAPLGSHDQSFFGVEPVNALGIYFPAFPLEHHRQPPISVPDPAAGQFAQSHPQCILGISMMLVPQSRPVNRNQPRRVPLAQIVGLLRPLRQLATHARLQSFFATISCRMCRSRLRSATRRFSLPFSSRSCRSSRSSLSPRPAYFFFQR